MKYLTTLVYVTDFALARAFYAGVLGGEVMSQDETRLVVELGQHRLELFLVKEKADTSSYAARAGVALVFQVDDVDETMADLKAKGLSFLHNEPAQNDYYRYVAFADPSGNVIEIAHTVKS